MKPRLVWLAAAYLALAGTPLAAQERVLTGTVTDSATGDPIAGASIGIQGTRIATHTNASGVFNLAALPDSDLTVMIRFIGYRKRDLVTVLDRCQPNTERSVGVGVGGPKRGRECQGSLPGPTGADKGQEPDPAEHGGQGVQLLVAADERTDNGREVRHSRTVLGAPTAARGLRRPRWPRPRPSHHRATRPAAAPVRATSGARPTAPVRASRQARYECGCTPPERRLGVRRGTEPASKDPLGTPRSGPWTPAVPSRRRPPGAGRAPKPPEHAR